jgi:chitinase
LIQDIDWEYPNYQENRPQDKENFNLLLRQLRSTLGSAHLLTVAIGAGQWRSDLSYDIPTIFATVDFVNVMTYDLHGSWGTITGIHGALFSGPNDNTASNVDASVRFLLSKGIDRSKIMMGIAAYGISFVLVDVNRNGVGAPATAGNFSNYIDLCQLINSGHYNTRWESDQRVPYAFRGSDWVGYENVRSVTEKANYINSQNLGGGMVWSLDGDDFRNVCGSGRFPLISTVRGILR